MRIREVGTRPHGTLTTTKLPSQDCTVVWLNGRELFRIDDCDLARANEIVIDWNDIGRMIPDDTLRLLENGAGARPAIGSSRPPDGDPRP